MPLRSALFQGDTRLEAAATSDPSHIVPGARGPHVAKIQQALNELSGAKLEADGMYGNATALAVADFKRRQQPPLVNRQGRIDDIVGIGTMAALDAGLAGRKGRLQLNFSISATPIDIVINFFGAPGNGPRVPEDALELSMLRGAYEPVGPGALRLLRHKANGRLLFRIAQSTNALGGASAATLSFVMLAVKAVLQGVDPANGNVLTDGRIFVFGTSTGGRNAIDFAGQLVQAQLTPHFLAAIDASFFQADTDDRPSENPQTVLRTPTFTLARIAAPPADLFQRIPQRHNLFQTRGNRRGDSLNPLASPFFSSDMAGGLGEIHGEVVGFTNRKVPVTGLFGPSDDNFHEECDAVGRRDVQLMIAKELLAP